MISRGGSQPQISRFYIDPTVKYILVFCQEKKYKYQNFTGFWLTKVGNDY